MKCPKCGADQRSDEEAGKGKFCPECGTDLRQVEAQSLGNGDVTGAASKKPTDPLAGEEAKPPPEEGKDRGSRGRILRRVGIGLGAFLVLAAVAVGAFLFLKPDPAELSVSAKKDLLAGNKAAGYVDRLEQISSGLVKAAKTDSLKEIDDDGAALLMIKDAATDDLRRLSPLPPNRAPLPKESRVQTRQALQLISEAAQSLTRGERALQGAITAQGEAREALVSDESSAAALEASAVAAQGAAAFKKSTRLLEKAQQALRRARAALRKLARKGGIKDQQVFKQITAIGTTSGSATKLTDQLRQELTEQEEELKIKAEELEPGPTLTQCGPIEFNKATDPISETEADPCLVLGSIQSQYSSDAATCFSGCSINVASVDTFRCETGQGLAGSSVEGGYLVTCRASNPEFYVEFYWGS